MVHLDAGPVGSLWAMVRPLMCAMLCLVTAPSNASPGPQQNGAVSRECRQVAEAIDRSSLLPQCEREASGAVHVWLVAPCDAQPNRTCSLEMFASTPQLAFNVARSSSDASCPLNVSHDVRQSLLRFTENSTATSPELATVRLVDQHAQRNCRQQQTFQAMCTATSRDRYSVHTATACFVVGPQGAYGWDPDDPNAPTSIPDDPCELLCSAGNCPVRNEWAEADRFRAARVLHPRQPVNVVVATCNNYRYVVSVSGSASDGLARIDSGPESASTPAAGSSSRQYTSAPFTVFPRTAGQMVVSIEAGPPHTAWGKPNEGPRVSHLTHVEYMVERRYMASFRLGVSLNTGPLRSARRSFGTSEVDGQLVIRREHEPRSELVLAFVPNVFAGWRTGHVAGRPRHLLYRDPRRHIPEPFIGLALVSGSPFGASSVEVLSALHLGLDVHLFTGMGVAGALRLSPTDALVRDHYEPGQVVAASERFTKRRIASSLSLTLNFYPEFFNIGGGSK